ncbi:hypothetical protein ACHQM5_015741 [Ranunculus cassubicifolius]
MRGNACELTAPGFRFQPTSWELIDYLHQRINNVYPTRSLNKDIFECDLYGNDSPWEIFRKISVATGKRSTKLYFFTFITKKFRGGEKITRATAGGGAWNTEKLDSVYNEDKSEEIGYKTILSYRLSSNKKTSKSTGWVMHEYALNKVPKEDKELVLCCVSRGENVSAIGPDSPLSWPSPVISDVEDDQSNLRDKTPDRASYDANIADVVVAAAVSASQVSNCFADSADSYYDHPTYPGPTYQSNPAASTSSYSANTVVASTSTYQYDDQPTYLSPTYPYPTYPTYQSNPGASPSYSANPVVASTSYADPTCHYNDQPANPYSTYQSYPVASTSYADSTYQYNDQPAYPYQYIDQRARPYKSTAANASTSYASSSYEDPVYATNVLLDKEMYLDLLIEELRGDMYHHPHRESFCVSKTNTEESTSYEPTCNQDLGPRPQFGSNSS